MTTTVPISGFGFHGNVWRQTSLLFILPALIAAGIVEKSGTHISLPDEDTYRSPLSENLLESNQWRIPQEEKQDWRVPPPPPVGWRTPQPSQSTTSSSKRTIELFPRYQSGNPSDFDFIEREEKPLIKIFEFGSK
jgi:hypothetical protein